jgi:hypothetical protein
MTLVLSSLPEFTYENTILIEDGIYTNTNLIINKEGTITQPIIIKAKNSLKK